MYSHPLESLHLNSDVNLIIPFIFNMEICKFLTTIYTYSFTNLFIISNVKTASELFSMCVFRKGKLTEKVLSIFNLIFDMTKLNIKSF